MKILWWYVLRRFLTTLLMVVTALFFLTELFNGLDILSRAHMTPPLFFSRLGEKVVPLFLEIVLPVSFIVASLRFTHSLTQSRILVVCQAFGVKKIALFFPMILCVLFFALARLFLDGGLTTLHSHLSAAGARGSAHVLPSGVWIRLETAVDGQKTSLFLYAKHVRLKTFSLERVRLFFVQHDRLQRVIYAHRLLLGSVWRLFDTVSLSPIETRRVSPSLVLPAFSSRRRVFSSLTERHLLTLRELPSHIRNLKAIGLMSRSYELRLQRLLSLPLFYVALALVCSLIAVRQPLRATYALFPLYGLLVGVTMFMLDLFIKNNLSQKGGALISVVWGARLFFLAVGIFLTVHDAKEA